jgi:hypothetical protein
MGLRPLSDGYRAWLYAEMEAWRSAGMLSPQQAQGILELYETPQQAGRRKTSLAMLTLMSLAAVMVGLAALLLVGYNWEAMPAGLKLAILFVAIFGSHLVGFLLRYRSHAPRSSEIAFLLGCLLYGVGIWQIAQIFHIQAHWPNGIWIWALGVLPLALCLDTLILHALLAVLLAVWAGSEVFGFGDLGLWLFGRWGYLPNGAYTLPVIALPCLVWAYRKGSPATVALYVLTLCWWIILQPFTFHTECNPVFYFAAVGALLLLIAGMHRDGNPLAIPHRVLGVLLTGGALVPMSFYDFNSDIWIFRSGGSWLNTYGLVPTLVVLVVGAVIFRATLFRSRPELTGRTSAGERFSENLRRQWFPMAMIAAMTLLAAWGTWDAANHYGAGRYSYYSSQPLSSFAIVSTIVANLGMIVLALCLIALGLREDRGQPFAAGILYFLLWSVLRYVDLFGEHGGMLGASLMFFLCGATLFGVAIYWRRRKEVSHG